MYANVYVINVPIRSISGTHSITEEDLGLTPGTLPPEELATMGHLIVVDKKALAPIEKLRAKTKRLLARRGVKVGLGTVVTEADYADVTKKLGAIKDEFYVEKTKFIDGFKDNLDARIADNPEYAHLIERYAPDLKRIERRLSFDIDTYKFDVPVDDPNETKLASTLKRSGNDISRRLIQEIADFVSNAHKGSIQKSQRLVKANLGPLRDVLLPKIKSFQLYSSSLVPVSAHLEKFIADVGAVLDAKPTGHAYIDGNELKPFEARLNQLRSADAIEQLIAASPKPSVMPQRDRPSAGVSTPSRERAMNSQLTKRPAEQTKPNGSVRKAVTF